jgi:RNA polymerase sigma-70 factor (ECF subfamily)
MSESTCWTVIRGAAEGRSSDREEFARRYLPVVRAYLGARWRGTPLAQQVEDGVQEVFLDCFKRDGALGRVDPARPFRAFLFGVARNVALRVEERRARGRERPAESGADFPADDPGLSAVFDRAWALTLLEEAVARHRAAGDGRRAELLRLRFEEDLPVREIAARWREDPARVHKEYARAREEFKRALLEVVAFHHPGPPGEVERECERLLDLFA